MPRYAIPALALLMAASTAQATTDTLFRVLEPDTTDLSEYRWNHRPVVIFAPSPDDQQLKQAMNFWTHCLL